MDTYTLVRLDLLLVEQGLADSRTAAQALIDAGRVSLRRPEGDAVLKKASLKLPRDSEFAVAPDPSDRFVSRGGLKLAGALAQTGLRVDGLRCLDVGLSTGGFADCLLQAGAVRVVGVDVGHGQLHPRLHNHPRLVSFEGVNARNLDPAPLFAANDGQPFDLAVADLSFISLTLVLPAMAPLLRAGGRLLCLVKPQFEVGREGVGRGGIVKDPKWYPQVRRRLEDAAVALGLTVDDWLDSPIAGGDGNREFFILLGRPA